MADANLPSSPTPDQCAAHEFLTELRTRIATQRLPYQYGIEARAMESLWEHIQTSEHAEGGKYKAEEAAREPAPGVENVFPQFAPGAVDRAAYPPPETITRPPTAKDGLFVSSTTPTPFWPVCRNPVNWLAEARKSPVNDHELLIGNYRSRFVLQRRRHALDQTENALTPGTDMGAVLNIVGRPKALSGCVVTLVEQRVEK